MSFIPLIITVVLLLFETESSASSCTDCETIFYAYFQNVSFDVSILFHDDANLSTVDGYDRYFGTKNDTFNTLDAINNIFYRILLLYRNESALTITQNPQTQLNAKSDYLITLTTRFVITTMNNNTHIMYDFFVDSSILLLEYFNDVAISLSFYHQFIRICKTPTGLHATDIRIQPYLYLFLVILAVILILMYLVIVLRRTYNNAYVVNDTLVLIIAVSQFDDKKYTLFNVQQSVKNLIELWRHTYHYSVYICNEHTLYAAKTDIIDFLDEHLQRSSQQRECVIIHIISHGGGEDNFLSSDLKNVALDFIRHELTSIDIYENRSIVKIIFNHSCRGETNYYPHMNNNNNYIVASTEKEKEKEKDVDAKFNQFNYNINRLHRINHDYTAFGDSNLIVVSGNIHGRTVMDTGCFSECIQKVFGNNSKRCIKYGLSQLLIELGRELQERTNSAELCMVNSTLRYQTVRFEVGKAQKKEFELIAINQFDSLQLHN